MSNGLTLRVNPFHSESQLTGTSENRVDPDKIPFIVHPAPFCALQPISLHRNVVFGQLNHIFCQYL